MESTSVLVFAFLLVTCSIGIYGNSDLSGSFTHCAELVRETHRYNITTGTQWYATQLGSSMPELTSDWFGNGDDILQLVVELPVSNEDRIGSVKLRTNATAMYIRRYFVSVVQKPESDFDVETVLIFKNIDDIFVGDVLVLAAIPGSSFKYDGGDLVTFLEVTRFACSNTGDLSQQPSNFEKQLFRQDMFK